MAAHMGIGLTGPGNGIWLGETLVRVQASGALTFNKYDVAQFQFGAGINNLNEGDETGGLVLVTTIGNPFVRHGFFCVLQGPLDGPTAGNGKPSVQNAIMFGSTIAKWGGSVGNVGNPQFPIGGPGSVVVDGTAPQSGSKVTGIVQEAGANGFIKVLWNGLWGWSHMPD